MGTADRPLTARSVLASTLLGTDPPRLPAAFLVRTGELFGMSEGSVRTALSRMVTAGEVERDQTGQYRLKGRLATRQSRQRQSRDASVSSWNGRWTVSVVVTGTRSPTQRSAFRSAMTRLRMAEIREGVWLRPDNLDRHRLPDEQELLRGQCMTFDGTPSRSLEGPGAEADEAALAARLWDLDQWASTAEGLRRRMHELTGRLRAGDPGSLPDGFVVSAAVLRHFGLDPLLPRELLPRHWPGERIRSDYESYDRLYRSVLSSWIRRGDTASVPAAPPRSPPTTIAP